MAYDPRFISDSTIHLPEPGPSLRPQLWNGGEPVHHTYHSLLFHSGRGFAACTAHNHDATRSPSGAELPERAWAYDPNISEELQVNDERGYRHNRWDRGHLCQRAMLDWGNRETALRAVLESDFWTNIAPQHEGLHDSAWGRIERWMAEQAGDSRRVSVFTGPVFNDDDAIHDSQTDEPPIAIPAGFWKIIALRHSNELKAAAFLVWQRDYDRPDPVTYEPVLEQVRITTIEYLTSLRFHDLRDADPLLHQVDARRNRRAGGMRPLGLDLPVGEDEIPLRPTEIRSPGDIVL